MLAHLKPKLVEQANNVSHNLQNYHGFEFLSVLTFISIENVMMHSQAMQVLACVFLKFLTFVLFSLRNCLGIANNAGAARHPAGRPA
jgi:hypothetical protein